jgi:hypothetical protein
MRESFIQASLKLAQRAISTLNDSNTNKSAIPVTQSTLGGGSTAAYSQESRKRKRNNGDDAENDDMDVGAPHGGDEETVDAFGTKQNPGKRARGHTKIDIACEYCRGRHISTIPI